MAASAAQLARHPLSRETMRETMERIMTGRMPPQEIADFLTTLAQRGETAEEIAAAVEALRRHAVKLPLSRPLELCDTCGTGGDHQGTLNISTLAAVAASACGVRVAKHGNRAASSQCGSADVLAALGLNLDATPERVALSIETLGFGFCFAPKFHPAMKAVADVRRQLGIRTIFNLVGPLANPAPLTFQLVGVSEERLMRPMAEALQALGIRHGLVVHGADGLDEATTTAETTLLEVRKETIREQRLRPEDVGIARERLSALRGGDAQANARIAREVLSGKSSPAREVVAFNAGCAIYVADRAETIPEGIAKATSALASGRAQELLDRVIELSK